MDDHVTFFHVKDPNRHAMTQSGWKTLRSAGRLIVYCSDDGPLDPSYLPEWTEWRREKPADDGALTAAPDARSA